MPVIPPGLDHSETSPTCTRCPYTDICLPHPAPVPLQTVAEEHSSFRGAPVKGLCSHISKSSCNTPVCSAVRGKTLQTDAPVCSSSSWLCVVSEVGLMIRPSEGKAASRYFSLCVPIWTPCVTETWCVCLGACPNAGLKSFCQTRLGPSTFYPGWGINSLPEGLLVIKGCRRRAVIFFSGVATGKLSLLGQETLIKLSEPAAHQRGPGGGGEIY